MYRFHKIATSMHTHGKFVHQVKFLYTMKMKMLMPKISVFKHTTFTGSKVLGISKFPIRRLNR